MGRSMGMDFGLPTPGGQSQACKRKFRWMFNIDNVAGEGGSNALPPQRSERPGLTLREMAIQHLNETIYYPAKPDWKPVPLVLYDLKRGSHPVFDWLKNAYNPASGEWYPVTNGQFLKTARLKLLDGCGNTVETWIWEDAWPQQLEFGELDMGNQELVVCTVTLRYARAYVEQV